MTLYVCLRYDNIGIQFYFHGTSKILQHMVNLVVNKFHFTCQTGLQSKLSFLLINISDMLFWQIFPYV